MKHLAICLLTAAILLAGWASPASAAWADLFPGPEIVGPGAATAPGAVLDTLTPELKYKGVGAVTYVYIFDAQEPLVTLDEILSKRARPELAAKADMASFRVPAGVLAPGRSYYWYVESIHAPGTKSEAIKYSPMFYFTTAKDAK